jgi:hypothetical protein
MSSLPLYQYPRLQHPDEIRLLILAPGSGWDDVRCKLEPFRLSTKPTPEFEALSYAWGESSATHIVICNEKKLLITESLHLALRHLRHPDRGRCLWADGVCINQMDDKLEKNHQLPLMGTIYSEAKTTLVWIGEDSEQQAHKAFQEISIISSYQSKGGKTAQQFRDYVRGRIEEMDFEVWVVEKMNTIAPIFAKPWFTRLWVVQEVFLSRNALLLFGKQKISLNGLRRVTKLLNKLDEVNKNQQNIDMVSFRNLVRIGHICKGVPRLPSVRNEMPCPVILELLRFTEGFKFSNERDRIYALLGMTADSNFHADYTLSVRDTYLRFAQWVLGLSPALSILSYARGPSDFECSIPSWSPSPHMDGLPITLLHVDYFKASGEGSCEEKEKFRPICVDSELRLKGKIIDSVWRKGETWTNAATIDSKQKCLIQCAKIANFGNDDDIYERFCRAMTLDISPQWRRALPEQCAWFHHYYQSMVNGSEQGEEEEVERITVLLSTWARCRNFCITDKGRFAWIPSQAQLTDEICIFRNSRIPHVIRWQTDGSYTLVGECWLEGMMEGEALELPNVDWRNIILV